MPIVLAVDTSAKPVSCALVQEDRILASYYAHTGLTHSQTLMSMIEHVLSLANLSVDAIDAVAVNAGPGSFTGVRIGVSAVKGITFTNEIPCIAVSTLEAMAHQVAAPAGTVICGTMDARCQQVYTALFIANGHGGIDRLTKDAALSLSELESLLKQQISPIILIGDGSELCFEKFKESVANLSLAPASVRFQNACGTALIAIQKLKQGETLSDADLLPEYLRLPQAERELNSRLNNKS